MKRSTNRILTTHAGSLARPRDLLEMMDAKLRGKPYDQETYGKRIRGAVADMVREQVECGVDIVTDGEQSKPEFQCLSGGAAHRLRTGREFGRTSRRADED